MFESSKPVSKTGFDETDPNGISWRMDMSYRFKGSTALVTGAGTGIGRATALLLGRSGIKVAVHYRSSKDEAEEVAAIINSHGGEAFTVQADVSRPDEAQAMVAASIERLGHLDYLVNNAGTLIERCPVKEMSTELWDQGIAVNLSSMFYVTRAAINHMLERDTGGIVNIASIAGYNGGGYGAVHYATAKGGVIAFTKGLALELAGTGIRVNCVNPGTIATAYHDKYNTPENRRINAERIAMRREGTAEEVAESVAFLLSENSSYIYGAQIDVNGGQHYR